MNCCLCNQTIKPDQETFKILNDGRYPEEDEDKALIVHKICAENAKFKVGDRVINTEGIEGTVTFLYSNASSAYVNFDNHHYGTFPLGTPQLTRIYTLKSE